jgi:hypothetical protein
MHRGIIPVDTSLNSGVASLSAEHSWGSLSAPWHSGLLHARSCFDSMRFSSLFIVSSVLVLRAAGFNNTLYDNVSAVFPMLQHSIRIVVDGADAVSTLTN